MRCYPLLSLSWTSPHVMTPTVHSRVLNSPPFAPVLSRLNLVHTLAPYFFQIHFNSILPSTPKSSKWSFSFSFPRQNYVCTSLLTHTSHIPHHLFGWVNRETSWPSFANLWFRVSPTIWRFSITELCIYSSTYLPTISYYRYWSEYL
jgi:hypothetical protein